MNSPQSTDLVLANGDFGLSVLDKAEKLLERVQTLPEARDLIATLDALKLLIKKADLGYQAQNRAGAIAIKTRRKVGQMLKAIERNAGARTDRTSSGEQTRFQTAQEVLNIKHDTAHKWQRLAEETTEKEIDQKAKEYTEAKMELTTEACLKNEDEIEAMKRIGSALAPIIHHPAVGVISLFEEAAEQIRHLPAPEETARTLPKQMQHAVTIKDYRVTVNWMQRFCQTWQEERDNYGKANIKK